MKRFGAILLLWFCCHQNLAQNRVTPSDIWEKNLFQTQTIQAFNWMNDGTFYSAVENNQVIQVDVKSGKTVKVIFDGDRVDPSIRIVDYQFSADERKLMLLTAKEKIYRRSYKAQYYIVDLNTDEYKSLSPGGPQSYATFSPQGDKVAFARDNDLFLVNLNDWSEIPVTESGSPNRIINGSTDWVYEEELKFTKAFFWSPDGSALAYYTFDETHVPEYNLQLWDPEELYPIDYRFKYPKAGEDNSAVRISVYHLSSGQTNEVKWGEETDIYIPQIQWTPLPNTLSITLLDRLQNRVRILHANAITGETEVILEESSPTYIGIDQDAQLTYLSNGKQFIWLSDRSGFKHFYRYSVNGVFEGQITSGEWEVTDLIGVDENGRNPRLYYLSTEGSALERNFFVIELNGKNKTRLEARGGITDVSMSPDFKYYLQYFNNAHTPLEITLHKTSPRKLVKELIDNSQLKSLARDHGFTDKDFFQFTTDDGTVLNGFLLKPPGFEASREYPLLIYQYSGPGSQEVQNSFDARRFLWHQMLAQMGYLVAYLDPRGTGGRGSEFTKITYGQLGKYESADLISVAKYLGSLPYVDSGRIGIWGWSYGGYTSALCMMLGADVFKMGISVAPVTSWRFYDTIYTERYLKRPQDNPSGYDDFSPVNHVEKLSGAFLLIHGTGDDNVHFQNSVALQTALIQAGKQFDSFYYPNKTHSISGNRTQMHLFQMMTDFITNNL